MADALRVACIQMTSGPNIADNLETAEQHIREAVADGARFVVTPENTCRIRFPAPKNMDDALTQDNHPGVPFFSHLAKELGIILLIGSLVVLGDDNKLLNRSFLFDPDGTLRTTYDKIHLFDVELPTGETHRESDTMHRGGRAVITKVHDGFNAGLSICYDLRFACLFRELAQNGANIMCTPAAFTVPTGRAHWEVLQRARAIETGSYVMAAAQVGVHDGGRRTYGHSMIVDPWGKVLSVKEEGQGYICADLNIAEVEKARSVIPALKHDREFILDKG